MERFQLNSINRIMKLLFLFGLFLIFRSNALTRDLAFEESTYLIPGRNLLLHHQFTAYMGELNKVFSPFHKPPLASLMPGFFSFLSVDWIHGGRLFPLLISLWVCFAGVVFFDSFLATFLSIIFPLLLSAASHIHTDATVGLLGVSLVSISIAADLKKTSQLVYLYLGMWILWCGKFEIAVCVSIALLLILVFLPKYRNRSCTFHFIFSITLGVFSSLLLSGALGMLNGQSFFTPFLAVFYGVAERLSGGRASGILVNSTHVGFFKGLFHYSVFDDLRHHKYFHFAALVLIPSVYFGFKNRFDSEQTQKKLALCFLFFCIFGAFTLVAGNARGDGFPRYYISSIPPLIYLFALNESEVKKLPKWILASFVSIAILLLLPRSIDHLRNPKGITGIAYLTGFREAAEIVENFTEPGDLVVAPEPSGPYLHDRKLLIDFTYEPYPTNWPKALELNQQIRAAIVQPRPRGGELGAYDTFMESLLKPLIAKGAMRLSLGSFEIYILPKKSKDL